MNKNTKKFVILSVFYRKVIANNGQTTIIYFARLK